MGNSTTSQNKASTSTQNTGLPNWAQVGSDAYKNMNSWLQTAPMGVAGQTFTQGGIGQTGQNAINTLQGGGAAQDYLTGTARGDYLNGSPYLDDIISKNAQDIGTQTNQLFAAGGRYGSGAHQGTLADSIGNMSSQLRNANYQSERDRQLSAANALESSQVNRAIGAAGLENQGFNNMAQMIGLLPTIQNNKVFDAQQQMGVGGQLDARAQQQLSDLINQWYALDNEDWARLGGLISAAQGSAGSYGTQTATQPGGFGALGGVLTLLSKLPFGSDRRLKENIVRVGERDGLNLYEFSYRGERDRWRGVMADEVAEIRPDAVEERPDGFLMVDYGKLGFGMEAVN